MDDLLGLKALSKPLTIVTKGVVNGASSVLSKLCMPAIKQVGLIAQDEIRAFRESNLKRLAAKSQEKLGDVMEPFPINCFTPH